ncbi:unnamed protein product [Hymenolepis diminuta]|uniref:Uncharacterized protein n=1 Tax=Hymenolepis diminuta TaxID=6216 RepID=A0A564YVA4_HYMDI|nr:unnamed protein product [Hymenolepis diminuta]
MSVVHQSARTFNLSKATSPMAVGAHPTDPIPLAEYWTILLSPKFKCFPICRPCLGGVRSHKPESRVFRQTHPASDPDLNPWGRVSHLSSYLRTLPSLFLSLTCPKITESVNECGNCVVLGRKLVGMQNQK